MSNTKNLYHDIIESMPEPDYMEPETKSNFQLALEDIAGDDPSISVDFYRHYGRNCLSIHGERINIMQIGYLIGRDYPNVSFYEMDNMRSDPHGYGVVYFWPGVKYVE